MKKALLVLFAIGYYLCGYAQEIEFETVEHDFGNVEYNATAVFDFVFTNTGTKPLVVQKPKSSSGLLIPSWPKDTIMPGEKNIIKATYRTNRSGFMNHRITVTSNAQKSSNVILKVKGYVWEEGIKVYEKNGYWGLEDAENHILIPFQYDKLIVRRDNELLAQKNNKWGVIDKTNNSIIPFNYDGLEYEPYKKAEVIYAKKNGKWGLINRKNETITQFFAEEMKWEVPYMVLLFFKFPTIVNESELQNFAGKWGAITTNGDLIIPPLFENVSLVEDFARDKYSYIEDCNVLNSGNELKNNGKGLSNQKIIMLQRAIQK